MNKNLVLAVICVVVLLITGCKKQKKEDTVKVGLLHSLSGTMAISEVPVRDSELLAVKEINEAGIINRLIQLRTIWYVFISPVA